MTNPAGPERQSWVRAHLDPGTRMTEVLFGLIMVLTCTLTAGLTVAAGAEGVRELLAAAVGCNVAWGLIDGVFHALGAVFERSRQARLSRALKAGGAGAEAEATAAVARELDDVLEPLTTPATRERLYREVVETVPRLPAPRTGLRKEDLVGAVASFWLVFLSTIPASVPFLVFRDQPRFALRVSNGLLLAMLFFVGARWAKHAGGSRLVGGLAMTALGGVLVGVAVALGG